MTSEIFRSYFQKAAYSNPIHIRAQAHTPTQACNGMLSIISAPIVVGASPVVERCLAEHVPTSTTKARLSLSNTRLQ